jgi:hypothetical protein
MTTLPSDRQLSTRSDSIESPAIDLDEIIRQLDAAYNRLPKNALHACQAHRELAIPRLINVLQDAVRLGQDGAVRAGNAPIFALFLLAEFEATESLPVVMEFLKLPSDIPNELLGDAISEDLPRILAILAGHRPDLLDELIREPEVNESIRWSAITANLHLVRDGRLPRHDVVARLRGHLRHATSLEDVFITGPLMDALVRLNANEARAEFEEAFEQDAVEKAFWGDLSDLTGELRPDEPDWCDFDRLTPTNVADAVEEMRHWHWSDPDDMQRKQFLSSDIWPFAGDNQDRPPPLLLVHDDDSPPYEPSNIRHDSPRVGRNDPCPCGSGKKYKKCCLR